MIKTERTEFKVFGEILRRTHYFSNMKKWIFSFAVLFSVGVTAQELQPYQLFTKKGKKTNYQKMVKSLSEKDIVLFGEYHDDAIAHWIQLELAKSLYERDSALVLGAEMFERNTQVYLDAYLVDSINAEVFSDTVPTLWPNYQTDYAPLVNFAKSHDRPFIATNIPRYLASAVYKGGFESLDTLDTEEANFIPPLPIPYDPDLPGYKAMLEMGGGHGGPNLPMAQAVKDATMAWSIIQHLQKNGMFLHFNGTYHSNNFEGIYWYLNEYRPGVEIGTIATVRQENLDKLIEENKGVADYILVVDEDMTRTY